MRNATYYGERAALRGHRCTVVGLPSVWSQYAAITTNISLRRAESDGQTDLAERVADDE